MPLVRCPDCNGTVSDNAPACPHCGCGLYTKAQQIADKRERDAAQRENNCIGWLVLGFAVMCGGLLILFNIWEAYNRN